MKLTKESALDLFKQYPAACDYIAAIKGKFAFVTIQSETSYKTTQQNSTFHCLLSCFWQSGCSSFADYDQLRLYYKRVAGLVYRSSDGLVHEKSWADATKEQAKTAIDMCIRDMDLSGVLGSNQGNRYARILDGIKELREINND